MLGDLVGERRRGAGGRSAEIARRLSPAWTKYHVLVALVKLFSGGVVGHKHKVGLWWVA